MPTGARRARAPWWSSLPAGERARAPAPLLTGYAARATGVRSRAFALARDELACAALAEWAVRKGVEAVLFRGYA